jgi:HlyD family secretion protein
MQIKALVNEARVTLVRPGQEVSIRVDALKDELIHGEVVKVNQYADPGGWSSGNIKKYATLIKITNPPESLRSGMNAEVRIHIERRNEALQVPVQSLAEYRGKFFMVVQKGDKYETREVTIGSTNDKTAVVEKGLALEEKFVMNPRVVAAGVPDLPEPTTVGHICREQRLGPTPAGLGWGAADLRQRGKGGPGGRKGGKGKGFTMQAMLEQFDTDKDEKLSAAEIESMDERAKPAYLTADKNSDGFVDKTEIAQVMAEMRKRFEEMKAKGGFGGPGGGPGGPPGGGQ